MQTERTLLPPDAGKTLEWITVLSAAGLHYRLSREDGIWRLHVPERAADRAWAEICAYEAESTATLPTLEPAPPPAGHTAGWAAFWFAHMLVLFYLWTGPFNAGYPVHMAGCAQAGRIMAGEWWRTLTALTLHSGVPHLAANVLFIALIGQAVLRELGMGTGLLLMVVAGMLGNALAASVVSPMQISVGASTMAFAALGIMSALQTVGAYRRCRHWRTVWPRAWIPMAAGIALLGFLGTAPQSDLAGHGFGFLAGAVLAMPFAYVGVPRLSVTAQRLLMLPAFAAPVLAWLLALVAA